MLTHREKFGRYKTDFLFFEKHEHHFKTKSDFPKNCIFYLNKIYLERR